MIEFCGVELSKSLSSSSSTEACPSWLNICSWGQGRAGVATLIAPIFMFGVLSLAAEKACPISCLFFPPARAGRLPAITAISGTLSDARQARAIINYSARDQEQKRSITTH